MRNPCSLLLLWAGLWAPVFAQGTDPDFILPDPAMSLPAPLANALTSIRASSLSAHIAFLASPALEGRGLGSRGLDAAAEYVAAHLALMNIQPFGETHTEKPSRGYFQSVPLREINRVAGRMRIERGKERQIFFPGVDWELPELEPQVLSAPLVFAGRGIREEALRWDDLKGLDLKGKLVIIRSGMPSDPPWKMPELVAKYGAEEPEDRYASRLELLARLGAKGLLVIDEDLAKELARKKSQEDHYFLSAEKSRVEEIPLLRVTSALGEVLLAGRAVPGPIPGASARIEITGEARAATSRNVIGCLPGSDPKAPAVILGAHMDHLGCVGEVTYPGADDNASGVAALLEIARAFAASPQRPRRTVIFCFWTGEEEAKFGSTHYVLHPLWPLDRTAVYINLDMIAHPWSMDEIRKLVADEHPANGEIFLSKIKAPDFVEPGIAKGTPELGSVLIRAGSGTGLALHLDRTDGRNGGSDYRAFARAGLPFVRFFGNFFPAYHQPGDTPGNLDPVQAQKLARLAMATAWMLAEQ